MTHFTKPRSLVLAGLAALPIACAPTEGGLPAPKPPTKAAPPAPKLAAQPARWGFDEPLTPRGQREVPGGELLSFGENGRRALHRRGEQGPAREAMTVLSDHLWGAAVRADGRFVFIGRSGRTFVTDGPLGAPLEEHAPPAGKIEWTGAGREAVFALAEDALHRSTDGGRTWSRVAVEAGTPAVLQSVAGNAAGLGLLHSVPQRLFVTRDDGATWSPLASPGFGAFRVELDASLDVALEGGAGRARYDATTGKLVPSKWAPFDFPKRARRSGNDAVTAIVGARTFSIDVEWKDEKQVTVLREGPLAGDKTERSIELLAGCQWSKLGAYGAAIGVLCRREVGALVAESRDGGQTFTAVAQVDGEWSSDGPPIQPGPDGYLFVAPARYDRPPRVRPVGQKVLVEAKVPEPIEGIRALAIDEASRRVFMLARTPTERLRMFSAPLDSATFTREGALDLTADLMGPTYAIAVVNGAPRLFASGATRSTVWDGATARYLPGLRSFTFAGARGVALGEDDAYETADAGETWTRISAPKQEWPNACSAEGCLFGRAERLGWDVPALDPGGTGPRPDLKLSTEPPATPVVAAPKEPSTVPAWTCAVDGAWAPTPMTAPEQLFGEGSVLALGAEVDQATQRARALVVRRDKLESIELLPAASDDAKHRSVTRAFTDHEGVVAFRYRYAVVDKGEAKSKVEVTASWVAAATGGVSRVHFLADPFRVSTTGARANAGSGLAGGALYLHPDDAKTMFELRLGAKPHALPFPEFMRSPWSGLSGPTSSASFARVGEGLFAARLGQEASLAWLEGAAWTTRQWSLLPIGASEMDLTIAEGKPWITASIRDRLGRVAREAWLFPIGGPANDPPTPKVVSLRGLDDGTMPACDATTVNGPAVREATAFSEARLRPVFVSGVEEGQVVLGVRSTRVHATKNGACVGVVRAGGPWSNVEPWAALIPADDPAHAWLFRPQLDSNNFAVKGVRARKLKCTLGSAAPPAKLTER